MIEPTLWWQRLEPRPRTNSVQEGLAAKIRDPLWMLGRQWQVGEFRGEDCGTPCRAEVEIASGRPSRISGDGWQATVEEVGDVERGSTRAWLPAETRLSRELGDVFLDMLEDIGALDELSTLFDELELRPADGLGLDGIALWQRAGSLGRICAELFPEPRSNAVGAAFDEFAAWASATFGSTPRETSGPWRPPYLDHRAKLDTLLPDGTNAQVTVRPDSDAHVDWHAMELERRGDLERSARIDSDEFVRPPTRISFPGMPHRRWWRFEEGQVCLPKLTPDKRDLATLLLLDFALVAGDDWFVVPVRIPRDRFAHVSSSRITDTFGETFTSNSANQDRRWQLFSLHQVGGDPVDALWTGGGLNSVDGPESDKLRYLRDEVDNLVWAIEERANMSETDGISRHVTATTTPPTPNAISTTRDEAIPRYLVERPPPVHWWPFAAVAANGHTHLRLAAVPGRAAPLADDLLDYARSLPLYQHAIPRPGVRVTKQIRMSRTPQGSARVSAIHRSRVGAGDERSGLAHDVMEQRG